MEDFDAAIVGAGPAGSATAIALARRGYAVVIVDKQRFPREKLCGDFVNPVNWPIFRELGVEERVLAQPHAKVTGFRITGASGDEAEVAFASVNQRQAIGLGLRRVHLDQVLLERAAELGVTIQLGCRIGKLLKTAQGWQLTAGDQVGWRAKILIGADGRNSWVAHQLGLHTSSSTLGRCIGFQTRLRSPGAAQGKIEIHLFPGGYAGLIGVGDGTLNLGLAIDRRELPREGFGEFLSTERLPQNPHLKAMLKRSEGVADFRSAYPVYFRNRRCYADGALLVGDAARVSEPVTGEGIYFAMCSGTIAAETIDQALCKGKTSQDFLKNYEQKCQRAFRSRLALNSLLRFALYRPGLVNPLIRLSATKGRFLNALVNRICLPESRA